MTTFEEFWPHCQPVVAQVAGEYGRRHHIHGAEAGDFQQELTLWLIENEDQVAEWYDEMEPSSFEKWIARCLRNESLDYGLDVKSQALGYERRDLYFYSKGEIKALLPSVLDKSKWLEPPQSDGSSSKSQAEGNNWVATLSDISRAFNSLGTEDRDILFAIHREEYSSSMLAEMRGVTEASMSYRHDRALKRLLDALGGAKPDPMRDQVDKRDVWRGRKAVSSAQARAMTGADYE